jgi:hypothetical protein
MRLDRRRLAQKRQRNGFERGIYRRAIAPSL